LKYFVFPTGLALRQCVVTEAEKGALDGLRTARCLSYGGK